MWGHYLLTLYRSLTRHWLYTLLNVAGLAVGIAVFLVLALLVRFETSLRSLAAECGQMSTGSTRPTPFPADPGIDGAHLARHLAALLEDYPRSWRARGCSAGASRWSAAR